MNAPLSDLRARIEAASSVLVVSHDRPDGDAIGSSVALGLILEKLGKEVAVVNADPLPEALAFLPGSARIQPPSGRSRADLLVVLDSAGRDRIADAVWEMAAEIPFSINLDHHVSNTGFGDLVHVDPASPATGQLVYRLAADAGWPLDAAIGENLLAAISTDTGSFRYGSTTGETMRIAGAILDLGVDVGRFNRLLYENHPRRRVEALRRLLQGMRLEFSGRCASVKLPYATTLELGLRAGDTEGVVDVIRAIDTVVVAILFEELADGKVRVSSRSKDEALGVGEICARFGGGGHVLAAGARLQGPLDEAEARFLAAVGEAFARFP